MINLEQYLFKLIFGYYVRGLLIAFADLAFMFNFGLNMDRLGLNAYLGGYVVSIFNWPVIIIGLVVLVGTTIYLNYSSCGKSRIRDSLTRDIKLAGKKMMELLKEQNYPLFETIRKMNLAVPALYSIQEVIIANAKVKSRKRYLLVLACIDYKEVGAILQTYADEIVKSATSG